MRIRRRLALYGAFVIGVAMLIFGFLLNLLAASAAPNDQDDALAEFAAATATTFEKLGADELSAGAPLFRIDLDTSLEPYVAVYTVEGAPLYTTGEIANQAPRLPAAVTVEAIATGASVATIRPTAAVELRVHARKIVTADDATVVVVAGQSTEFVENQLAGLRFVIWAAAIITLIAAIVVSWLVSGRALRPLRRLAATTDEIGRTGDFSRRLPSVKTRDEVGTLTTSFNAMLDRVETTQSRLTESLGAQRRFVADASHELRSPLTTIRSNAGFLLDRPDAAERDHDEAISDISAEADRMTKLVNDLLTLAQADADLPVDMRPVDLSVILNDVRRRSAHLDRPVVCSVVESLIVDGDEDALRGLTWILVDNAVTHGAGEIRIELRDGGDSTAHLTVCDEGQGFPQDALDRVFERFYRADPARSSTGSGLGLAIAFEIVTAHGGTITASNNPGGGARVEARLPLAGSQTNKSHHPLIWGQ